MSRQTAGGWIALGWLVASPWVSGEPAVEMDLRLSPTASTYSRYLGALGNGRFGVPVCGGHDFDGDGHAEVAFAGVAADPFGRAAAGNVTLIWGERGTFGELLDTQGIPNDRVTHIAGAAVLEVTGAEMWMDDVDGDGLGDLLIGRQNFSPAASRRGAGGLTILFGGPALRELSREGQWVDLTQTPQELPRLDVWGASAYDRLSIWMRTGDVDGDGVMDLAVGADEADHSSGVNAGEVYLIRGGPHLREHDVIDLATYPPVGFEEQVMRLRPPPESGNAHFGATVQLGDLDGNGRSEVIVAATLDRAGAALRLPNAPRGTGLSQGGLGRGTTFILWDEQFAPDRWVAGAEIEIDGVGPSVSMVSGGVRNVRFGEELLGGGDFDGDGSADLLIGDLKGTSDNGLAAGLGHVFFHAATLRAREINVDAVPEDMRVAVIEGGSPGALAADTVGMGDFNEDGLTDLVVGSPHARPLGRANAGSLHIIYGQQGGWPEKIDLAANALPEEVRIAHVLGGRGNTVVDLGDTLGYSLGVGDANGDGTVDIITNEMQGNGGRLLDVGNLVVLSGRALLAPPVGVDASAWRVETVSERELRLAWWGKWRTRYQVERSANLLDWESLGMPIDGKGEWLERIEEIEGPAVQGWHYRVRSSTIPLSD